MFAKRKNKTIEPTSNFYKRINNIGFKIVPCDEIDEKYIISGGNKKC
jgi:hypothetical protein